MLGFVRLQAGGAPGALVRDARRLRAVVGGACQVCPDLEPRLRYQAYRHLAMASVLPCVQVSIAQAGAGAGQGTGAQFERVSARFIRGSKRAVCLLKYTSKCR